MSHTKYEAIRVLARVSDARRPAELSSDKFAHQMAVTGGRPARAGERFLAVQWPL